MVKLNLSYTARGKVQFEKVWLHKIQQFYCWLIPKRNENRYIKIFVYKCAWNKK